MGRRRRSRIAISLFAFMSVLVCVIGALTLIIISSVLGGTVASEEAESRSAEVTEAQVAQARAGGRRDITQAQVNVSKTLLDELLKRLREITSLENSIRQAIAEPAAHQKELASQTDRLNSLLSQVKDKAVKLRALEKKLDAMAGNSVAVAIPQALKGKHKYHPIFIECRKDGIVILQNSKRIPRKEIEDSDYIETLLDDVKTAADWCVFMLVRSDGVESFDELYFRVCEAEVPYGLHPIYTDKKLSVADWKKPNWLEK